ncbi:SGNH/GDSL hydrolase family protein [Lonepinella sp. BR2474]|uniref:SGNH/GDSL hydrolase family protein n=1 Tax=Lonepinella sp. BR2474 TaxID=3434548 RepID=UPI003F6DCDC5
MEKITQEQVKTVNPLLLFSVKKITVSIVAALMMLILLEAQGLVVWSERLDNPRVKSFFLPITQQLYTLVQPLKIATYRKPIADNIHQDGVATTPLIQLLTHDEMNDTTPRSSEQPMVAQEINVPVESVDLPIAASELATNEHTDLQTHSESATILIHESEAEESTVQEQIASDINNVDATMSTSTMTATTSTAAPTTVALLNDKLLLNLPPLPTHTVFSPMITALPKQALKVALVGDSMMAVGLAAQIQHYDRQHNMRFIRAYKSGTGLSRPDVFNWLQEYPKMIKGQSLDLAIVAIGANDAQPYYVRGKVIHFGSAEWLKIYAQRVNDFAQLVSQPNLPVIWLGLPAMKSAAFNKKVETINRLTYHVLSVYPNITWLNTNTLLSTDGTFQEYGKNAAGKTVRLRTEDGIHFTYDAGKLLVPAIFQW